MPLYSAGFHLSDSELWQAVRDVPLPDVVTPKNWFRSSKTETFQERLSSKQNLTEESSRRLVEEYRRFLYLKAIDGGNLTPSKRVDEAWHLHMELAGEGWTQFCDEVLRFRIDHQTGLSKKELNENYARLFDLYRREFNQTPPSNIWPGESEKWRRVIGHAMSFGGLALIAFSWYFTEYRAVEVAFALGLFILGGAVAKDTDLERVANCG